MQMSAVSFNFPPVLPVSPITLIPSAFATLTAPKTFLELPDVLIPIRKE
jgi:hypothetical protein